VAGRTPRPVDAHSRGVPGGWDPRGEAPPCDGGRGYGFPKLGQITPYQYGMRSSRSADLVVVIMSRGVLVSRCGEWMAAYGLCLFGHDLISDRCSLLPYGYSGAVSAAEGNSSMRDGPPGDGERLVPVRFGRPDLYRVRAAVAGYALAAGWTRAVGSVVLVAAELASNAVVHGGGRGVLELWRAGSRLCCRVSDDGPGIADPSRMGRRAMLLQPGGRGLWLVRRLADTVIIDTGAPGTTVTAIVSEQMRPDRDAGPVEAGDAISDRFGWRDIAAGR